MKRNPRKRTVMLIGAIACLIIVFACVGLFKDRIAYSSIFRTFSDKIDFVVNANKLKIPEDALSFSIYDMDNKNYIFYEGGG